MTAHRCAGGPKKKLDLRSGSQRHRHFVGFVNVPVLAPTRDQPFYTLIPTHRPISRLLRSRWGYRDAHSRLNPPGPHGGICDFKNCVKLSYRYTTYFVVHKFIQFPCYMCDIFTLSLAVFIISNQVYTVNTYLLECIPGQQRVQYDTQPPCFYGKGERSMCIHIYITFYFHEFRKIQLSHKVSSYTPVVISTHYINIHSYVYSIRFEMHKIYSILHFIHRLTYPLYLPHAVTMNLEYFIICKTPTLYF